MARRWPLRLPRILRRERVAFLGLGSNVGDRLETIRDAVADLDATEEVTVEALSSVYETEPVVPGDGDVDGQPDYLNCAVCVTTRLDPLELLEVVQGIEDRHGRDRAREGPSGPRPLDIDLLLYDDEHIDEPELTVPHPRLTERAFVLVPLAEVMPPGARLPDGTSVAARLAALAPISGVEHHVRLVGGPGAPDPLERRPPGPRAGSPRLGERRGGPGMSGPARRHREAGPRGPGPGGAGSGEGRS